MQYNNKGEQEENEATIRLAIRARNWVTQQGVDEPTNVHRRSRMIV